MKRPFTICVPTHSHGEVGGGAFHPPGHHGQPDSSHDACTILVEPAKPAFLNR